LSLAVIEDMCFSTGKTNSSKKPINFEATKQNGKGNQQHDLENDENKRGKNIKERWIGSYLRCNYTGFIA
jgi:hypothetical protein